MIAPATHEERRADALAAVMEARKLLLTYGSYDAMPADEAARYAKSYEHGAAVLADLQAEKFSDSGFLGWAPTPADEIGPYFDPQAYSEVDAAGRKHRVYVPHVVDKPLYSSALTAYVAKQGDFHALGPVDRKTLSEGIDTSGGFMVDRQFMERVVAKMAASTAIYSHATRLPVKKDLITFPRINYGADDKYTSAMRFVWAGEFPASVAAIQSPDPLLGEVNIPVHTALASAYVSRALAEDSILEQLLSNLLGEAFALGEADAYLNGNGVARPLGILAEVDGNGPQSVASGTSAAITTSSDEHSAKRLYDLYRALPSQYRQSANFVLNSTTEEAVDNLIDANKRPVIQSVPTGAGMADFIKNRPLLIDEFTPDIAAASFPILFGDLAGYYIMERVGMSIRVLQDHPVAETNQCVVLARRRVGGYCAEPYRLKVLKAS